MSNTDLDALKARVAFRCRRGMLGLDAVLKPFFEMHYNQLDQLEQQAFARMLDEEDPDLQSWLMIGEVPRDPEFKALVTRIRTTQGLQ